MHPSAALGMVVLLLLVAFLTGCGEAAPTPEAGTAVTFRTEDGLELSGTSFGAGTAGVILAHMYPADQTSWFSFAERLATGRRVLAFDFRGYGESEGEKDIGKIDRDVAAAVELMRSMNVEDVVLVGASMGGTASLIAAARRPVAGVVTLSAPVAFQGLDARPALPDLRVPVLFLAAEGDGSSLPDARAMAELVPGPTEVVPLPGDRHGTDLLSGSEAEEVEAQIRAFVDSVADGQP